MIYHITFPHKPFLESSLHHFESVRPGINKVILLTNKQNERNPCSVTNDILLYKGALSADVVDMVNSSECSGVFIYWLTDELMELVLKIDKNIPIYWRSYGPDINNILYKDTKGFYEKETKKLISNNLFKHFAKNLFRPLFHYLNGTLKIQNSAFKKKELFLRRINYVGTVTNYEFEQINKFLPNFSAKKLVSILINPNPIPILSRVEGRDIMVGHSSFPILNHVDVFDKLSNIGLVDNKIIVPLSYGNREYGDKVINYGKKLFGSKLIPLIEYLPLEKYNEVINQCNTFILNSLVQQGGANIRHFLLTGKKVYIHHNNPLFIDLVNQGFKLFSIQRDLTFEHLYNYQISQKDKERNRILVLDLFYSEEAIRNHTNKIIKVLGG